MVCSGKFPRPTMAWTGFVVVAAMVTTLLTAAGCSTKTEAQGVTPGMAPAVPVLAGQAKQQDVPITVSAIGVAEAYSTVNLKAQVTGQLIEVNFEPGQFVKAGDVLFKIDPKPFEAALHQAQAKLAQDQALLANAMSDAKAEKELYQKQVATQREYEQAQAQAMASQAAVKADQAAVEEAKLQLGYTTVASPVNGRTGAILVHSGNVVKANETDLVSINQVMPIYVDFGVPEQYLDQVRVLMDQGTAKVSVSPPHSTAPPEVGKLTFLDNQVDRTTGMIMLKATFANESRRLWPGQFVNATLELGTIRNAVTVPTPAVQTSQEGRYVFVINDDKTVRMQTVTVGQDVLGGEVNGRTVIEKGLKPGQTVVTDGQLRLTPGAKVTIKKSLEAAAANAVQAASTQSTAQRH